MIYEKYSELLDGLLRHKREETSIPPTTKETKYGTRIESPYARHFLVIPEDVTYLSECESSLFKYGPSLNDYDVSNFIQKFMNRKFGDRISYLCCGDKVAVYTKKGDGWIVLALGAVGTFKDASDSLLADMLAKAPIPLLRVLDLKRCRCQDELMAIYIKNIENLFPTANVHPSISGLLITLDQHTFPVKYQSYSQEASLASEKRKLDRERHRLKQHYFNRRVKVMFGGDYQGLISLGRWCVVTPNNRILLSRGIIQ